MDCGMHDDDLAAFVAQDLAAERHVEVEKHVSGCAACRAQVAAIRRIDAALVHLPRYTPTRHAEWALRQALTREVRPLPQAEVLTLDEVAEFLRVGPEEMDVIAGDLPAFEMGGRLRVRKARLLEWIEQRERTYRRGSVIATLAPPKAGPAKEGAAS